MSKHRSEEKPLPACYAQVLPGLEKIAGEEIADDLGGEVKRSSRGLVVFRLPEIEKSLLELRTTEDVFGFAWGTDKLSYRAEALDNIRRWTAKEADWDLLFRLHQFFHPRPKGKPTYRLVTQMTGEHGFRRMDARQALARGLAGKVPGGWRYVEDNAALEIWLTIHETTAVCGVRLSDKTMRHRTYKLEHLPASLRPTLAAAMARLAGARPGMVVLDPMCGAGTILAEVLDRERKQKRERESGEKPLASTPPSHIQLWGGDREGGALHAARINLRKLGPVLLTRWDATRLPLAEECVDRLISNPPFGKQLSQPEEIGPLYRGMVQQYDRVLRPGGRAVLLVSDAVTLKEATEAVGWKRERFFRLQVLGQSATLSVWRKPG